MVLLPTRDLLREPDIELDRPALILRKGAVIADPAANVTKDFLSRELFAPTSVFQLSLGVRVGFRKKLLDIRLCGA